MNVVFFNSCKSWGGGEKWHYEMAFALKNSEFNISAIGSPKSVFSEKIEAQQIPLKQIAVSGLSFLNPIKIIRLTRYFKKQNIETLVINLSADLKLAGFAAKLAGVKNIVYRRGSAIPIKNKALNRYIFKNIATHILANSEETKRTVLANNSKLFPEDIIHVIYNGLHLEQFQEVTPKDDTEEIVLGNLARLSYQKGQWYLVNLAERLKEAGIKFKLLIGGEGEMEQELKTQVVSKKLNDVIEFVGFVSNPKAFLEKLDVFVFPSIWEGFGFSIVEAKLCSKPVVAFNISSNPEVIVADKDGFLIEPFDETAFFEKSLKLIRNKELRLQMGQAGREDALQRFSHTKCVEAFKSYLKAL